MHLKGRVLRRIVCCALFLIAGGTVAAENLLGRSLGIARPRPGSDFPDAESFYPRSARVWGQEGFAVVYFCVDDHGRLSGEPSIRDTSGDLELDAAALALAKAGDGHYLPAYLLGQAMEGCAVFRVQFVLRESPNYPTLLRRAKQLTNTIRPRWLILKSQFQQVQRPGALSDFVPGNQGQLQELHAFVASVTPLVRDFEALLTDYIAKMDELGRAEDVSEAERTAFSKSWQAQRAYLRQNWEMLLDAQALVAIVNDLINHVESAHAPLGSVSGPHGASPQQNAEIRLLVERGRMEYRRIQARLKLIDDSYGKTTGPLQNPPGPESNTAERFPKRGDVVLETVGSAGDLANDTPNVTVPQPTLGLSDIQGCISGGTAVLEFEGATNLVQLHLSDTGSVSSIEIERTSGFAEVDAEALKCIPSMRFRPATRDGKPVVSVIQLLVVWKFTLEPSDRATCEAFQPNPGPVVDWSSNQKTAASVVLCNCWEQSGRPLGPRILQSSGTPRFDEGALKLAQTSAFVKPRPPGHPGCVAYRTQLGQH